MSNRIVFFDGYCVFCSASVDWILPRDVRGVFRFAPIQGKTAAAKLPGARASDVPPDSILYLRDGVLYDRSTAILRILADLGGPWRLATPLLLVPRPVRDFFYEQFARRRYRLFGKRDTCRLPTPAERERLLD